MTAMIKLSKKGKYMGRVDISGSAPAPKAIDDASLGETPKTNGKRYHSMFG